MKRCLNAQYILAVLVIKYPKTKHSDWHLVHLQNLNVYNITDSLVKKFKLIKSEITNFKISNISKKEELKIVN